MGSLTSFTGSGQSIYGGPQISSNRVSILVTYHLVEIRRQHARDLKAWTK